MNEAERAAVSGARQAAIVSLSFVTNGQGKAVPPSSSTSDQPNAHQSDDSTDAMDTFGYTTVTRKNKRQRKSSSNASTPSSPLVATHSLDEVSVNTNVSVQSQPVIAIISATLRGEKIDFNGVSPIEVGKRLSTVVSRNSIKKIKPRRDGSLLIEVTGEAALLEIKAIFNLGDWDINHGMVISRPKTSKGVITGVHPLISMSELIEEAESPALILKAERLTKREGANRTETRSVAITFDSETLPEEIKIGFNIHKVRQYIPDAQQCYKCRRWGDHIAKNCKSKERCARCGAEHQTKDCTVEREAFKCVNCKGSHSAAYRGCPYRKTAQKVVEISTKQGVSTTTAKAMVKEGKSFAAAAKSQAPATSSLQQPAVNKQTHVKTAAEILASKTRKESKKSARTRNDQLSRCTIDQIILLLAKLVEILATTSKEQSPNLSAVASLAQEIINTRTLPEESDDELMEGDTTISTDSTISIGEEGDDLGQSSFNTAPRPTTQSTSKNKMSKNKNKKSKKRKGPIGARPNTESTQSSATNR
jgi:hypothetical protein